MMMKNISLINKLSLGVLAFASVAAVNAQSMPENEPAGMGPEKEGGRVTLSVGSQQDFFSNDKAKLGAGASVEYRWANGLSVSTNTGLTYNFSSDPNLQYGVGLGADFGRKEDDKGTLSGMGKVDSAALVGAFFNYNLQRNLKISTNVKHRSSGNNKGINADIGINYDIDLAPKWRLGLGVNTSLADSNYMQTNYGVSTSQSESSGNAVYTPSAGLYMASSSVQLSYQMTPSITITGGVLATQLLGDAKKSSLVTRSNNLSGNLSIGYSF